MPQPVLDFTFYIAAPIEKVWDGFVSKDANKTIFMGADFEIDLRPGGATLWYSGSLVQSRRRASRHCSSAFAEVGSVASSRAPSRAAWPALTHV